MGNNHLGGLELEGSCYVKFDLTEMWCDVGMDSCSLSVTVAHLHLPEVTVF
jgi:hypothetical protein